jgi:hypothetical protein
MTLAARLRAHLHTLLRAGDTARDTRGEPPHVHSADRAADTALGRASDRLQTPDPLKGSPEEALHGPLPILTTASLAAGLDTGPLVLAGVSAADRERIRVRLIAASLAAMTWHDPENVILGDVIDTPEKQLAWDLIVHDALHTEQHTGGAQT